jgi:hypothetical protein
MKLHVPQFFLEEVHWKFKWFKCELIEGHINPPDECKELGDRGKAVESRSNALAARQKAETLGATLSLSGCYQSTLLQKKTEIMSEMAVAIDTLSGQIATIRSNGGNPEQIADETGAKMNLVTQLESMKAERDKAIAEMDRALAELEIQDKQLVAEAGGTLE